MMEEQIIVAYFHKIDELMNTIRGLGENIEQKVIDKKSVKNSTKKIQSKGVCHRRNKKHQEVDDGWPALNSHSLSYEN